jgi:hypothetical protein
MEASMMVNEIKGLERLVFRVIWDAFRNEFPRQRAIHVIQI